jgi:hypothetical protein
MLKLWRVPTVNGESTQGLLYTSCKRISVQTRILRVLHIAIHCPLPAAKIRGPKILEVHVSPCSD